MKRSLAIFAFSLLAACAAPVPDSNPGGVGFNEYQRYSSDRARREAQLAGDPVPVVPQGPAIGSETVAALDATQALGPSRRQRRTAAVSNDPISATPQVQAATTVSTVAPVATDTGAAEVAGAPRVSADNPGISDEQSFDAVAERESIESDRERLERQRASYQVIEPEALPTRSGGSRPSVVEFALATSNRVGEKVYRRTALASQSRFNRACARYTSSDLAQEAFLANGGPKTDRRGVDPDGDGFACFWDPTPFRAARAASSQ